MARIKGKDIYLETDDQIYFGPNQEAAIWWDGAELRLNHTISGVDPTKDGHLVTKRYVDNITISGSTASGIVDWVYDEDDTESSTTSTAWTEKLSISSTVPSGDYIILWSYEWSHSDTSRFFDGRLQLDDTTNIMGHHESTSNTANWVPVSGFKRLQLSGSHTLDLDYRSSKKNKTAYIRRARLELWRI